MKYHCTSKYNHSTVWSETPCICICKDSVKRHSLQINTRRQWIKSFIGSRAPEVVVFSRLFRHKQLSTERPSRYVAMECLYWLIKSEIPHTSLYGLMIEAVKFMGCDQLCHLQHGDNAKYTSQRITQRNFSRSWVTTWRKYI